jgi:uncharacterized membrane protein YhaH (DUF805 family)
VTFFNFSGRASRREFALTHLAGLIFVLFLESVLETKPASSNNVHWIVIVSFLMFMILLLAIVIGGIAVTVRRFHDLDRPGRHYLRLYIPLYNIYLFILLFFKRGTPGPNNYGIASAATTQKHTESNSEEELECSRCGTKIEIGASHCQGCGDVLEYD